MGDKKQLYLVFFFSSEGFYHESIFGIDIFYLVEASLQRIGKEDPDTAMISIILQALLRIRDESYGQQKMCRVQTEWIDGALQSLTSVRQGPMARPMTYWPLRTLFLFGIILGF